MILASLAWAQSGEELSLSLVPGVAYPFGDNASYFGQLGGSAELAVGLGGVLPLVEPRLYMGYDYLPLSTGLEIAHVFDAGLGLALPLRIAGPFSITPQVLGGYEYGFLSDGSVQGGDPFVKGGLALDFRLWQGIDIGLDAAYRYDFDEWSGIEAAIYTTVRLGLRALPVKGVKIASASISPVFPALFKLYDGKSFGTLKLVNQEKDELTDVSINFFVASYMDNPTLLFSLPKFAAGAEEDVPLKALFSEQVLKITESTKVSGKVSVSFTLRGKSYTNEFTEEVRIDNRNSLTWDDTRKAAVFVTPNDPLVLTLSKNALAAAEDQPRGEVDKWLSAAMVLHEALRIKGQRYSTNPNTPFSGILHNANVVDTVLFPQEELSYGAGNCSDLTALYCSLLESLGAHTAFITIPGHIYAAVQLEVPPDRVPKVFSRPTDLIVQGGKTWLPVEVTMCADSFLDAWKTGAQEWRDSSAKGETEFLPVEESWLVYEPVGQIPVLATSVKLPDEQAMKAAYKASLNLFVDQELAPRVEQAKKKIEARPDDPRPRNELGIVYAQYGRLDDAAVQFAAAGKSGDYVPAIINLAHVRYLGHAYKEALALYHSAESKEKTNAVAVEGALRCDEALQRMDEARAEYSALKAISPALAAKYRDLEPGPSPQGAATPDAEGKN
jgi:hypothetical protein